MDLIKNSFNREFAIEKSWVSYRPNFGWIGALVAMANALGRAWRCVALRFAALRASAKMTLNPQL
jgi:hypothetical protein